MPNFLEPVRGQVGPALFGYAERTYVRPLYLQLCVVLVLMFSLAHAYVVRPSALLPAPIHPLALVSRHPSSPAPSRVAGSSSTTPPSSPLAAPVAVAIPDCKPVTYSIPRMLDLTSSPGGVTVQVDTPAYYQIYGNDSATVRTQLVKCSPKMSSVEAAGNTSYTIDWQYDYTNMAGMCTVDNTKVGVHIGTALPQWNSNISTLAGFANKMHAFSTSLATHEQGHVNLDIAMANTMLTQLSAFAPTSCDSLANAVNTQMQQDLTQLNALNDNYDTQTSHGATQGAIVP